MFQKLVFEADVKELVGAWGFSQVTRTLAETANLEATKVAAEDGEPDGTLRELYRRLNAVANWAEEQGL
jgi:hypothetical protein